MNRNTDLSRGHALLCLLMVGVLFYSSYGFANWLTARRVPVPEVVFGWEVHIPFWAWSIVPYWSLNLLYAAAFFVARSRAELYRYVAQLIMAQLLAVAGFLLFPLTFGWPKPAADGVAGWLFASLAAFDQPYNQAPSLHIILTMVVGRFYWHRLPKPWRLPWLAWLLLIGVSVLTTYQHHFIDIPTGVAVGALIWWWFPQQGPAPWQRRLQPQAAHRRWLALYLAAAVVLAVTAYGLRGAGWWLWWPVLSLLLLAAAYAGLGANALQKQAHGRHAPATALLLWPLWPLWRLNMAWWLRRAPLSTDIGQGVRVGSILAAGSDDAVVDVCAEYPLLRPVAAYRAVPMLDMAPPESRDLAAAAAAVETLRQSGRPVLLCCALGYGRSVAVALLWLWRYGGCGSLAEAEAHLRGLRPQMVLPPATRSRIEAAFRLPETL